MFNSFSEYTKYKKKLSISYQQKVLDEIKRPASLEVFKFIVDGSVFIGTQSALTIFFLLQLRKKPFKPQLLIKYITFTFINMQVFLRNHLNEYPYKNEKDLSLTKRLLISTTGPSFCIMKDVNILRLMSFVRLLNPIKEFKNNSTYTVKL